MTISAAKDRTAGVKGARAAPMRRPERYKQLLQSAQAIVEREGAAGLTMSALTKEAGVSRPVVYEHFENSQAIAIALLEDYFENIVDLVDERARDAQTLDEYLTKAIEVEFEYHSRGSLLVRNLTNGHATSKGLNQAFLKLRQRTIDTFKELLSQQGASEDVARVGGYALTELIPNVVYEFASSPIGDAAREILTDMVLGAIHAVIPESKVKPETPAKVLQASLELKQARKDLQEKGTRKSAKKEPDQG